jgi:hypothetical protein
MNTRPITLADAHRHIQQAWRCYVLPAYLSHDSAMLLAALVVANTGLDELLLAEGYHGETSSERLQNASRSFSDYTGLRMARRIRDRAVHELDYPLCRRVALPALATYTLALWEHGVPLCACQHSRVDGSSLAWSTSPAWVADEVNGAAL